MALLSLDTGFVHRWEDWTNSQHKFNLIAFIDLGMRSDEKATFTKRCANFMPIVINFLWLVTTLNEISHPSYGVFNQAC